MRLTNFLLALVFAAPLSAQTFQKITADPGPNDVGVTCDIAVDPQGRPHVSYYDNTDGKLKYATRDDIGVWTIETADSGSTRRGLCTSIALDSDGQPHISYYDETNANLKYAYRLDVGSGFWVQTTVESGGDVGRFTSIALDANDDPHIAYHDFTNGWTKYATRPASSWMIDTVDTGDFTAGWYCSIALDSNGKPHMSYQDAFAIFSGVLKYATNAGGSWAIEIVDASGIVGSHSSIALDGNDAPRISYHDRDAGSLRYADRSSGSWSLATADLVPGGTVGEFSSLALDANDDPRIAYFDRTNGDLKFASRDGFAAWQKQTVDGASDHVGQYAAIALDAQGDPHIAHYSVTDDRLEYAFVETPTGIPAGALHAGSIRAYPNPARNGATFNYARSSLGTAYAIDVFDLRGRLVRRLPLASAAARGRIVWDAENAAGRQVAPGVYFLRFDTDTHSSTSRVIVVR